MRSEGELEVDGRKLRVSNLQKVLYPETGFTKGAAIDYYARIAAVCQRDHTVYLSVAGTASVVRDLSRIEEVWKEPFRVWFPEGIADPHLVLIHVIPDRAEYWDNQGLNQVSYLWEAAIAYVTGETPRVKEGEKHGVVSLT